MPSEAVSYKPYMIMLASLFTQQTYHTKSLSRSLTYLISDQIWDAVLLQFAQRIVAQYWCSFDFFFCSEHPFFCILFN